MPPEADPTTTDPEPTAPKPADPPEPEPKRGPATPPAATDPPGDLATITRERDAARREAARTAKELEKLQQAAKERDDAEKSELTRAQERAAAAEQAAADAAGRLRETQLRADAQTEALRLGYLRPERAWRELDTDAVEFDDDGRASNLAALLEVELEARPELKGAPKPPPDAGGGERGKPPVMSREQLAQKVRDDPGWVKDPKNWEIAQEVLGRAGR